MESKSKKRKDKEPSFWQRSNVDPVHKMREEIATTMLLRHKVVYNSSLSVFLIV